MRREAPITRNGSDLSAGGDCGEVSGGSRGKQYQMQTSSEYDGHNWAASSMLPSHQGPACQQFWGTR
jgi:hypothetical protein